jgi:hypothetical protein
MSRWRELAALPLVEASGADLLLTLVRGDGSRIAGDHIEATRARIGRADWPPSGQRRAVSDCHWGPLESAPGPSVASTTGGDLDPQTTVAASVVAHGTLAARALPRLRKWAIVPSIRCSHPGSRRLHPVGVARPSTRALHILGRATRPGSVLICRRRRTTGRIFFGLGTRG